MQNARLFAIRVFSEQLDINLVDYLAATAKNFFIFKNWPFYGDW